MRIQLLLTLLVVWWFRSATAAAASPGVLAVQSSIPDDAPQPSPPSKNVTNSRAGVVELEPAQVPFWFDQVSLVEAVKTGSLEAVRHRLAAGDNAATTAPNFETYNNNPSGVEFSFEHAAIHAALRYGHFEILKYLVEEAGMSVNFNESVTYDYGVWRVVKSTPLELAASANRLDMIKYLVGKGAKVNPKVRGDYGESPLTRAIAKDSFLAVKYLLEAGADVNEVILHVGSPLLYTIKGPSPAGNDNEQPTSRAVLALLLDHGAKLEAKNVAGETPLLKLTSNCDTELVKFLVQRGADVNTRDSLGNSPLHLAVARRCELQLVKYLVGAGAELRAKNEEGKTPGESDHAFFYVLAFLKGAEQLVNKGISTSTTTTTEMPVKRNVTQQPPSPSPPQVEQYYKLMTLEEAVGYGCLDAVRYRIQTGGDSAPESLILEAAKVGNLEVFRYLVEQVGLDVDFRDDSIDGRSPLHYAADSGSLDVIRYLVERGANVSAEDISGRTPLHLSSAKCELMESVKLLAEAGRDLNATSAGDDMVLSRGTPLHVAVQRGCGANVWILVEAGASLVVGDSIGQTPLHLAISLAREKQGEKFPLMAMIQYLFRKGSPLNTSTKAQERTPLHDAVLAKSLPVVAFLVENGADVNAKDSDGNLPLHLAAGCDSSIQVIKYLLAHGADKSIRNNEGWKSGDYTRRGTEQRDLLWLPDISYWALPTNFFGKIWLTFVENWVIQGSLNSAYFSRYKCH